jgi:DNA polymerase V
MPRSVIGVFLRRDLRHRADYCANLPDLEQAAIAYTTRAAERLRHQHSIASGIQIYIRTNPHQIKDPQYQQSITVPMHEPTSDTRVLCHAALVGLRKIYRTGYAYQKVGMTLTGIMPATSRPKTLFDDITAQQKSASLMQTMDQINHTMGSGTVQLLGEGIRKNWAMRRGNMSKRYTTEWDELPVAQ